MLKDTKLIISRIGETDQLSLTENSPTLALERSDLRLQLVTHSHARSEQVHFLQEAIVLLEQARVEYEEMPLALYLDLSLQLAKAYMMYFEITKQAHFALITQQILRPLMVHAHGDIYFYLAYAAISKNEKALMRHWLSKYVKSSQFDHELMSQHAAFAPVRDEDWFQALLQSRLH